MSKIKLHEDNISFIEEGSQSLEIFKALIPFLKDDDESVDPKMLCFQYGSCGGTSPHGRCGVLICGKHWRLMKNIKE